jgi:hypothetical protein
VARELLSRRPDDRQTTDREITCLNCGVLGLATKARDCRTIFTESSQAVAALACCTTRDQLLRQEKMDWAEVTVLFGLACFTAIAFFMVYRNPQV